MKITVETSIDAPVDVVWEKWTTPEDIMQWDTASVDWHTTVSTVDLRPGGQFSSRMEAKDGSMGFDFEGEYTRVERPILIEANLEGRSLLVEFIEQERSTLVRETFEADDSHSAEQQRQGWQAILDRFKRHVENK